MTLRADRTGEHHWCVDASFAVHPDCRSHAGAVMTMGGGAITSISHKQGMNACSSTEAEVVAAMKHGSQVVDQAIPRGTRPSNGQKCPIPGQQECNAPGRKWLQECWKKIQTSQHEILFLQPIRRPRATWTLRSAQLI